MLRFKKKMLLWMFYTQPDLLICLCVSLFSVGCSSLFILLWGFFGEGIGQGAGVGRGRLLGIRGMTFSTMIYYKGLRTEKA